MDLADNVTERITSLEAWTTSRAKAVAGLPRENARAAKRSLPHLLAAGLRHAPKHTGALRRSLRVVLQRTGDAVSMALTSDDPAARVQQAGGLIRARLHDMTVPIGVERDMWDATGTRREARDVPGLFQIRARDGRAYLVTREGRRLVLRFQLRRTVRQDAQYWATDATREAAAKMEPTVRAVYVSALLGGGEHRP